MPSNLLIADAHARTMRLSGREIVERLNRHLGATLVATLSGVKDRKLPYRWARDGAGSPNPVAIERLTAAHRVWLELADAESDDVARAWFVGANPYLDERAPVMALRAGEIRQVLQAAQAFLNGTWQG